MSGVSTDGSVVSAMYAATPGFELWSVVASAQVAIWFVATALLVRMTFALANGTVTRRRAAPAAVASFIGLELLLLVPFLTSHTGGSRR
jgi:hypothetical protein